MPDQTRCPTCGKNNPAGSETCRFCGTRLAAPDKNPPAASSSPAPDWLSDLRSSPGGEELNLPWMEIQNSEAEGDDVPDWLKEIGGPSKAESAPSPSPANEARGDIDWLDSLAPESPQEPSAADQTGVDNWLASLQDEAAEKPAESRPPSQAAQSLPSAGEDTDLAEWLKSLDAGAGGGAAVFSGSATQPEPEFKWTDASDSDARTQDTGVTEWLNSVVYQPSETESAPSPDSVSLDDWLAEGSVQREEKGPSQSGFGQSGSAQAGTPQEPAAPVPDWLTGFGAEEPARPAAAAEPDSGSTLPDWLSGFTGEKPAAEAPALGDLPDWLSESASHAEPVQQSPASPEIPDFQSWGAEQESLAKPVEEPAHAEIPDFSTLFAAETPAAQMEEPHAVDMPDFAAMFAQEPAGEQAEEPAHAEMPDFSAMFGEEASGAQAETPGGAAQPPAVGESLQAQTAGTPSAELEAAAPDWLTDFAEAGKEPAAAEASASGTGPLPFIDPQAPDWLSNIQPPASEPALAGPPALFEEPPQAQPELEAGAPFQVELPDWLEPNEQSEPEVKTEAGEPAEQLARADLPGWVQEMRPLESVIPGSAEVAAAENRRVEKAGPLAGMRGVVAPEDPVTHFRKLPAYSARLKVSERQRTHASLLQNVLDVEAQPFAVPSEPSHTPQYLYRLVVAVVLILALLGGMLMGGINLFPPPVPGQSDAGLLALYNEIESVPPGARVLLAVDYEPALAGEMRMAASSVIEHLMVRGANITLISTVPAGPILGQNLVETVQLRKPDYQLAAHLVNLGYLPGGTTSLLEFSDRPFYAAPLDYQGYKVWGEHPALKDVKTIRDFALVLVLTDSAETGRAWVEQVSPRLGSVPLAMVASAQAGPLLLPYVNSGQVTGMLSGLTGGAMYEQKTDRVNLANLSWNSYQSGMLAGILMLVIGGVISAGINVARKPRAKKP